MRKMNALDWIAWILIIVGALNWGIIGIFMIDVVDLVLGTIPWLVRTVYILVGVSGLYAIWKIATKE